MNRTEPHPIELLLLGAWLALEAAAVVLAALVALLLTVARWRPAAAPIRVMPESPIRVMTPAPAPPQQHPLAVLADELAALTVRELQVLAGTRRKLPKAQLIAMAIACG